MKTLILAAGLGSRLQHKTQHSPKALVRIHDKPILAYQLDALSACGMKDIGIVLGSLLAEAIYPVKNMERFGSANIVMDEACVSCDLDLSNRPYLVYEVDVTGKVGQFDTELVEEFFKAFVSNARISAHIVTLRGKNKHHIIEAAFKSFAVALRRAMQKNDKVGIPSTKDML